MAEPKTSYDVHLLQTADPMEALRDLERQINEQNRRMAEAFSEAFIYGGIGFDANTTATTVSAANTLYQVVNFTENHAYNGTLPSYAQSHIEVLSSGIYLVMIDLCAESVAGDAYTIHFEGMKNNGATLLCNVHAHHDFDSGGGEVSSVGLSGYANLSKGDTVELWVENVTDTDNVIIEACSMHIFKISNEAE